MLFILFFSHLQFGKEKKQNPIIKYLDSVRVHPRFPTTPTNPNDPHTWKLPIGQFHSVLPWSRTQGITTAKRQGNLKTSRCQTWDNPNARASRAVKIAESRTPVFVSGAHAPLTLTQTHTLSLSPLYMAKSPKWSERISRERKSTKKATIEERETQCACHGVKEEEARKIQNGFWALIQKNQLFCFLQKNNICVIRERERERVEKKEEEENNYSRCWNSIAIDFVIALESL